MINSVYSFVSSFFYEDASVPKRNSSIDGNSTRALTPIVEACNEINPPAMGVSIIQYVPSCIDVFIGLYPEYAAALQGNKILISCLKRADLLTNSHASLQVLDAFLGRAESHIQYSPNSSRIPLLHFAALGGQKATVEWLVSVGGWDLRKRDEYNDSVLDYAFINKQKEIISWLEDKPGFGIAKAISKLFVVEWRNPAILTEEIGCDIVKFITYALSESDLLEISENLENLRDLFEDVFKAISVDVSQLLQMKGEFQGKANPSTFDGLFFKIIRVISYVRLENPQGTLPERLNAMIELAYNKYVQKSNSFLGKGAFAQVHKVYHVIDERFYAMKLVERSSDKQYKKALEDENEILSHINAHNPVSSLALKVDWIRCNSHYGLVMELHGQDIYKSLIEKMHLGASLSLTRKIAKQLIESLYFLEKVNVVHSDVKPENILLRLGSQDQVVLTDFGTSFRLPIQGRKKEWISHGRECQTAFYRSPECALHTVDSGFDYGYGIDMWSLGCVLTEIFRQKSLFPFEAEKDLRAWHMIRLGQYPESLLSKSRVSLECIYEKKPGRSPSALIKEAFSEKQKQGRTSSGDAEDLNGFIDLVERMLTLDPEKRISTLAASQHDFVKIEGGVAREFVP